MADRLLDVADGFWNVRGSFKVAGLIDVGTQCSLVRRKSGDFVLLDSYPLSGELERRVLDLTDQGRAVCAILNLHPFHTLHVATSAAQFPHARLYGTSRHKARAPGLRWESLTTDDEALHALFSDDFVFTVPRGVEFIPSNEALHFASVLALHVSSQTLHVDDTLTWLDLPLVGGLKFHPTLRFVLQKRERAAASFRDWAEQLIATCQRVEQLCTAHGRALPPPSSEGVSVARRIEQALANVEKTLQAHERRYLKSRT